MKIYSLIVCLLATAVFVVTAQTPSLSKNKYGATQLVVKQKPYLLLAGEVYNSSASNISYMQQLMPKIKEANINTLLVPVSWEMIEKKEGEFDFSIVNELLALARKHQIKLGILWFGTWKNGISPYVPLWVLKDVNRFKRVKNISNENTMTLSPFCEATLLADTKAYVALLNHIKKIDALENTVIAIQVENEVGVFAQTKDYCKESIEAFQNQVPTTLINYLQKNINSLEIELKNAWEKNGFKKNGTWTEIFGVNDMTDLFFMAWHYASYIQQIAAAGKKVYALPTFVNCWMPATPTPNPRPNYTTPGKYPSGGPVIMVADIWKAAAPAIDILTPDIYGSDFDLQASFFHKPNNPLFIPETNAIPGRAVYSFTQHNAICFSPFGIDDKTDLVKEEYGLLQQLASVILENQGSKNMQGFYKKDTTSSIDIPFNQNTTIRVYFKRPFNRVNEVIDSTASAYGVFIKLNEEAFLIAGKNIWVSAFSNNATSETWIKQAEEGTFKQGKWITNGIHNGDEAGFLWSKKTPVYRIKSDPTIVPFSNTPPAIFKFQVVSYSK